MKMATEEKEKNGKPDTDLKDKVPAQTVESPIDRIEKEKIATGDNPEGKEKKDDSKKEETKDSKDASAKDEEKKDEEKDKKEDKKSKKAKTQPGTPAPPYGITHSELIRLQVKKKKTINFIIIAFFSLLAVVIFIAIVSVKDFMNRQKSSKRAVENIAITKVVQESPLKSNFQAMSEKINKDAASKNDIDANIAILQEFVDKYSSSYPQDEWVEQAKTQIKAQEELKMMY